MNALAIEIEPDLGAAVHRAILPAARLRNCDAAAPVRDQPPWNSLR